MKDARCPFCQSENLVLAEMHREELLKKYDREAWQMQSAVPDSAIKKWTGLLMGVCVALAGLALLTGIVLAIWAPFKARLDYRTRQRHERNLEELLVQQDMEGIYDYIYDNHLRSYSYPKFEEISRVYGSYEYYRYNRELLESYRDDDMWNGYEESRMQAQIEEGCGNLIEYAAYTLQRCRQYSRDDIIYGDEALFEEYYGELSGELQGMGLSDAQLEWLSTERKNMRDDAMFWQIVDLAVEFYEGKFESKLSNPLLVHFGAVSQASLRYAGE